MLIGDVLNDSRVDPDVGWWVSSCMVACCTHASFRRRPGNLARQGSPTSQASELSRHLAERHDYFKRSCGVYSQLSTFNPQLNSPGTTVRYFALEGVRTNITLSARTNPHFPFGADDTIAHNGLEAPRSFSGVWHHAVWQTSRSQRLNARKAMAAVAA